MIDIFDEVIEMADVSTKALAEQNRLLIELSRDESVPLWIRRKILTMLARTRDAIGVLIFSKNQRETV